MLAFLTIQDAESPLACAHTPENGLTQLTVTPLITPSDSPPSWTLIILHLSSQTLIHLHLGSPPSLTCDILIVARLGSEISFRSLIECQGLTQGYYSNISL